MSEYNYLITEEMLEEQSGFRKELACIDNMFTIKQIIEKCKVKFGNTCKL